LEQDTLIGQQIGAYAVQSKLGEGGMARVYKAYHARLRREVAIKVILSQIAEQADFKVRFEREAQLVASLQHPNIVAVYDFGDWGNLTYLVMQFVGGGTLRDRLRGGYALDPRQATQYTILMGKALHHAHLRGIVHRDVKPQNMLLSSTDPNQLLLSDFGIAKLYDTRREAAPINADGLTIGNDASLTSIGQIVGTAEYMAPEQIDGRPVDARTDVYALGIVLFQMLTGEAPFQSTTVQGLLYQHVHTPPRQAREVNPYISEHLSWIVTKAMAKAPADRFQSAEEMAQALEAANSNATYQLSSSTPPSPLVGQDTRDPLALPSQQRPTVYTPQSGAPQIGVASSYGQQPLSANTPAYGTARSSTHPSGVRAARPRLLPLSYIGAGLVLLLAIVLILARTGILPLFGGGSTNTTTAAQSFTETFQDNHLQWTIGSLQGLNASLAQNSYVLDIPQSSQPSTYFPYPKGVGYLPGNFTWSAKMEQTTGQPPYTVFYGLAFQLTQNGSSVSCYAFIIDGRGDYQVFKYIPGVASPSTLAAGQSPAITTGLNHFNELQARVQGNKFYFTINGTAVNAQAITDNSGGTLYTGGEPALIVAGSAQSQVSFTVMQAQLTVG
jgi:serine/threonine protein kinase